MKRARVVTITCAGGRHAHCTGRSAYAPIRCQCDCHCVHFREEVHPLRDGTGRFLAACAHCGAVGDCGPVTPPYDQDAEP